MGPIAVCLFMFLALSLNARSPVSQANSIAITVQHPEMHLAHNGSLVFMGNASLEEANYIFLPEVHDDPESLFVQLLLIAQERQNQKTFVILDESLPSMQRSVWDIFSQKSLEIITAREMRKGNIKYTPKDFEKALKNLAQQMQNIPDGLQFLRGPRMWTLASFRDRATPFFGWDLNSKASLLDRNIQMIASLKKARQSNERVLVMAGARHIPELEFLTSQKLLCPDSQFKNHQAYFRAIEEKSGQLGRLPFGVGTTLPIHKFLDRERYVIVFKRSLYNELNRIVLQFKNREGANSCLRL
ncbi:MAG TPA: hypothetical protein VEK06_02655 [Myxococcota bacterium]|nr:hypothetical protein [Myxococcota bacterium]